MIVVSAINTNDASPLCIHADKAYDQAEIRIWISNRGISVRIAGKGIEVNPATN